MNSSGLSLSPAKGEVWMLNFDPTLGHEQSGVRPAVIVSTDLFNSGPADLLIVLPITTRSKRVRTHVELFPPEGGLTNVSYVKCEDIRSVSKARLIRRLGKVSLQAMDSIQDRLRILLDL